MVDILLNEEKPLPEARFCKICKVNKVDYKGKGYGYRSSCRKCFKYRLKEKKENCEICGFKAMHPCQLDIHHKDHNHFNNAEDNQQTLCANCHRLEHVNFSKKII